MTKSNQIGMSFQIFSLIVMFALSINFANGAKNPSHQVSIQQPVIWNHIHLCEIDLGHQLSNVINVIDKITPKDLKRYSNDTIKSELGSSQQYKSLFQTRLSLAIRRKQIYLCKQFEFSQVIKLLRAFVTVNENPDIVVIQTGMINF